MNAACDRMNLRGFSLETTFAMNKIQSEQRLPSITAD